MNEHLLLQLNEKGEVTCQHGEDECELNAWHACILEHNDINISLKLIACMMRGRKNNLDKCANRYGIDVTAVKDCKSARSVDEILKKYAEATAQVDFRGVPAIAVDNASIISFSSILYYKQFSFFNQEFKSDDQDELSDNFDQTFCAKYKAKFNIRLKNC